MCPAKIPSICVRSVSNTNPGSPGATSGRFSVDFPWEDCGLRCCLELDSPSGRVANGCDSFVKSAFDAALDIAGDSFEVPPAKC